MTSSENRSPPWRHCRLDALRHRWSVRHNAAIVLMLLAVGSQALHAQATVEAESKQPLSVTALGRIEPEHGVITLSAPSTPDAISGSLLERLLVEVGGQIEKGQLLAVTDTAALLGAKVEEAHAEIKVAERQLDIARSSAEATCVGAAVRLRDWERLIKLRAQNLASEDEIDRAKGQADAGSASCKAAEATTLEAASRIDLQRARLQRAELESQRALIRAPSAGKVLAIHARPGEMIGPQGILDMGQVDRMYAIAEVYENDIGRLRPGQTASIHSPALANALTGRIERIRPMVRKMDQIGTDPAARKDARIVEVEVLLDEPEPVADRTHLQVEIIFRP